MPNTPEDDVPSPPAPTEEVSRQAHLLHAWRGLSGAAPTVAARLEVLCRSIVPQLADWCVIDLQPHARGRRQVHIVHANPHQAPLVRQLARQYSPNPLAPFGVVAVMGGGEPAYFDSADGSGWPELAVDETHRAALHALNLRSVLSVALPGPAGRMGVMSWASERSDRLFDDTDLRLACDLAEAAGMALETARQLEESLLARRAAEGEFHRLSRIQAVSSALLQAPAPESISAILAEQARWAVEAAFCRVDLQATLSQAPAEAWTTGISGSPPPLPPEAETPVKDALTSREAVYWEDLAEAGAAYPDAADAYLGAGIMSLVVVPLGGEGSVIGTMVLGYALPRTFDEAERALIRSIAEQGGRALARSERLAASRQAQWGQEDLLAGLAHDLTSPLSVIQMHAYMLETHVPGEIKRAQSIMLASERIGAMVETAMDCIKLRNGTLAVMPTAGNLHGPLDRLRSDVAGSLAARNLTLEVTCPESLPAVALDGPRIVQALTILLGFGSRGAPAGSALALEVVPAPDGGLQVSVSHPGSAMPVDLLRHLLAQERQPAWEQVPGMGPGLTVVDGIIGAHGGRFGIDSHPEFGTVFRFTLPAARDAQSTR